MTRPLTPEIAASIKKALRQGYTIRVVAARFNVGRKRVEDLANSSKVQGDDILVTEERELFGPNPLPVGSHLSLAALPVLPCLQQVGF